VFRFALMNDASYPVEGIGVSLGGVDVGCYCADGTSL